MVKTLIDLMAIDCAVSFVRQGDSVVITVRHNGVTTSNAFSLEELWKLKMGDEEAADYILSEALDGLYNDAKSKATRDAALKQKLEFHLGRLNEQCDVKEETE